MAGNLVRSGAGTKSRYVGSQPALTVTWEPSRSWTLAADLEYFLAGPFLRESGPAAEKNVTFASLTVTYRY